MELDIIRFEEFLDRHERVVLQFSAGKDSLACLKLVKPYLNRIIVMWANGGNPYPETVDYMERVKGEVPHFVELVGEQPGWIIKHGMPVDTLPVRAGHFGPQMHGEEVPLLQPFNQCCAHNLWEPMGAFIVKNGITGLIRGQKDSDYIKPPFRSGDKLGPLEFYHPIESWTTEEVVAFLGDEIPDSYKRGLKSSLDCMNCTAYVKENKGRIEDLELIYPPAAKQIQQIHTFLREELRRQLHDLGD